MEPPRQTGKRRGACYGNTHLMHDCAALGRRGSTGLSGSPDRPGRACGDAPDFLPHTRATGYLAAAAEWRRRPAGRGGRTDPASRHLAAAAQPARHLAAATARWWGATASHLAAAAGWWWRTAGNLAQPARGHL